MLTTTKNLVPVCAVALVTACGGGGGGGTSVSSTNLPAAVAAASLDASNKTVASQDVTSLALGLFDTSSTAFGVDSPKDSLLYTEAFSHLDRFPVYFADTNANPTVVGVVPTQTYSCPSGGSFSASVNDADNNSRASAGDTLSVTYNNCVSGSVTISGSVSFTITALTGTYGTTPYTVGASMSLNNLSATSPAYSAAMTGAFAFNGTKTGTNAFTQTISVSSLSASANYAGVTRSRSLSGFSGTETRVADNTYGYVTSYSVSGTLASSGFSGTRSVSFTTPTTFQRRGTATYPYVGGILITGASNSSVKITTLSNTQVQVELDANGDAIFESSTNVNWNTLI